MLKDPSNLKEGAIKAAKQEESTFITKGAENPTVTCENCNQEIARRNYDLHIVYCMKNITKCPYCQAVCDIKELKEHIDSK